MADARRDPKGRILISERHMMRSLVGIDTPILIIMEREIRSILGH